MALPLALTALEGFFSFFRSVSRSYFSTAMTTTNGLSYLVTPTGAMRAASTSSPKWFLASPYEDLRMRLLVLKPQC
jgi:hypothetical protein